MAEAKKPTLLDALKSWRTGSVSLLSFASGLPLGLVWIAIPDWLRSTGADIRVVGLVSLVQIPWALKIFWSPLMDRYSPPFWGRRRGWIGIAQLALFALTLALAGVGSRPDAPWVILALALAIAVASATQDIAYDAYAVEVLHPEEQGVAVGARQAIYRAAMSVAGGISITLAGMVSWPVVNIFLALLYLPMLAVTWHAPEPDEQTLVPKTLRQAVWHPFVEFCARRRALAILGFLVFYKLADNLATSLIRPFLIDMGYNNWDRGIGLVTVGLSATLFGGFVGGLASVQFGLGHALWIFGVLQTLANLGYVFVARSAEVDRWLMFGAVGLENLAIGLGTGAFGVLLLRLARKRYAATQYAFFTVLFALPRILSGPITGYVVNLFGCEPTRCYPASWEKFFWLTIPAGIPGLLLLARFSPIGTREPTILAEEETKRSAPVTWGGLLGRGFLGGAAGFGVALLVSVLVAGWNGRSGAAMPFSESLSLVFSPADLSAWIRILAMAAFSVGCGLLTAAVYAARHGAAKGLRDPSVPPDAQR
ncbi:MAG: MFS transporter [Pseudomonadota bacterium]